MLFPSFTQFTVASGVMHYVLPKNDNSKWIIAAGLAQMSEFSFLLASRARRFGLIGREVRQLCKSFLYPRHVIKRFQSYIHIRYFGIREIKFP